MLRISTTGSACKFDKKLHYDKSTNEIKMFSRALEDVAKKFAFFNNQIHEFAMVK